MKIGRLGINQIMVLNRCISKGLITISGVELIYGFSNAKRYYSTSVKKAILVLEKLQLYGLVSKVRVFLFENLNDYDSKDEMGDG